MATTLPRIMTTMPMPTYLRVPAVAPGGGSESTPVRSIISNGNTAAAQFRAWLAEWLRMLTSLLVRPGRPFLTQREFLALLRGQYLNPTIVDDEDGQGQHFTWEIGDGGRGKQFPKVPSDEGRKLMESGAFGSFDWRTPDRLTVARRLLDRELGLKGPIGQKINQGLMAQSMIPSTKPDMVIYYDDPVCCGQFSDDGNFFYACVKVGRIAPGIMTFQHP